MGTLMVLSFGALDLLVGAPDIGALLSIRIAISICLMAVFWCSFQAWFDRHYLQLMTLIYAVTSTGILIMPMVARDHRVISEHYYVGALLCLSAMMTLTLVSVRAVLALTAFIVLAHLLFALLLFDVQSHLAVLMCQIFFLVTSAYIGFIGVRFRNSMLVEKLDLALQLERQMDLVKHTSREKSRFMAAASHDLRQPLQAIALFGAVLEKQLVGKDEHAMAERLMLAVGALGSSLESMLDNSKLDAGVVRVDMRPVEINDVLRELNHVFSASAENKGLQLRLRASDLWVYSDAELLKRLLSNLVDNAIKYTQVGGVIVHARFRNGSVCIDVVDTGQGIPAEHVDFVFEEFYQVDNPGRDRSKGLGVGLAVVRRLARLLGHEIQLESQSGKGTRVRLQMRAAAPQIQLVTAKGNMRSEYAQLPRRVLVLDDEGSVRDSVAALLGAYGVPVTCTGSSLEAMQAIESAARTADPFEVLVCDYRLSRGEDGLSTLRGISELAELNIQVLMLTGETAAERLQSVQASGVQVLFKPVSASALLAALEAAATSNRGAS